MENLDIFFCCFNLFFQHECKENAHASVYFSTVYLVDITIYIVIYSGQITKYMK